MAALQNAASYVARLLQRRAVQRGIDPIERIASLGLAATLWASGLFAIGAATVTTHALHDVSSASALNGFYDEARYDVGAEESLERKYRLEPSPAVRSAHRAAEDALERTIRATARDGDAVDRSIAANVLAAHARYVTATRSMFDAVDAHRDALARTIDRNEIDPVFAVVEQGVFARAARQRGETAAIVVRLSDVQRRIIYLTLALAFFSVVMLIAYFAVLRAYKRRLAEAHDAEMRVLEEATLIDHLTGIGNHRAYQESLRSETSRAVRHGETLSLAVVDVDDMKLVNDQNGHMRGDVVLSTLGSMLRDLRAEDRAFRVGGDEFVLLLPNTVERDALALMDRLRAGAEANLLGATISIGIASLRGAACEMETLQGQADAALYAAKRAGRNSVVTFDADGDDMHLLSPSKMQALRNLVSAEGVTIAFQPIWDVDGCNVVAYEALARPLPEYGFSGPQEAFDLAERVGRAHEIDAVCRRATLRRAAELPEDVLLFVNVSPQSLDHGRLDVAAFAADVAAAGLRPERVVIEITERSVAQLSAIVLAAKELQGAGFRIALDDTGAGNAGLEMLSKMPVDFVKIDREIIVKAMTERNARGVMAGIIAIARETDAYVIAEGIEDVEMLDLVCSAIGALERRRGVQGVQGYLLQRPSETIAARRYSDEEASNVLRGAWFRRAMTGASAADRAPS